MATLLNSSTGRLPGFSFEARTAQLADKLPRMDVAVFVGFAASGPIDIPVPVESGANFAAIFGADCPLASTADGSGLTNAYLAPAVRAFFRNGGRRCWIVRVARTVPAQSDPLNRAQYNLFRVPGLCRVKCDANGNVTGGVKRAYVRARSAGSWSDALRVGANLISRSLQLAAPMDVSNDRISLRVVSDPASAIRVGDLIRLEFEQSLTLFLEVAPSDDAALVAAPASPLFADGPGATRIVAQKFVWVSGDLNQRSSLRIVRALVQPMPALRAIARLTFEFSVHDGHEYAVRSNELAFQPAHASFWGALPVDDELYGAQLAQQTIAPTANLWQPSGDHVRFPLAGAGARDVFYLPTSMAKDSDEFSPRIARHGTSLQRDGLAEFSADLFLDQALADAATEDLLARADYIRYQSPASRALKGMYAAFALEEATIIAVPDAVHVGWSRARMEPIESAQDGLPPYRPEWWHFEDCNPARATGATWQPANCAASDDPPDSVIQRSVHEPRREHFLACDIAVIEAPQLAVASGPDASGTTSLRWTALDVNTNFVVEEATRADFADAVQVYAGTSLTFTVYGRKPGNYYYRVKAQKGRNVSDWSNGVALAVRVDTGWTSQPATDFRPDALLAVQRALLRMSAARGDLLAVLSLPAHFREDDAISYVHALKATPELSAPTAHVPALGYAEVRALSFGALYHPWLLGRDEQRTSEITSTPPCGSLCGQLARRAIDRGAWIATANQPLDAVAALAPVVSSRRRLELQQANINLIRSEPRGFLVLDADTLSNDPDLRQINVRRLLALLRRAALRLGATYVFEPHDDAFRRLVKRGFESLLERLFERGAFAGATPDASFQVVIDEALNNRNSVEQGRLIVELRVAPSVPLRFLTIRLVQTSDSGFISFGSGN